MATGSSESKGWTSYSQVLLPPEDFCSVVRIVAGPSANERLDGAGGHAGANIDSLGHGASCAPAVVSAVAWRRWMPSLLKSESGPVEPDSATMVLPCRAA